MSTSTSKASWTPEFHKMFVDVCFEVIFNGKGNEPGTRIGKEGWRKIVGSFNAKAGVRYDKRQIKNHYDATRKQWKVWVHLIGDGSMKWDPETNQFGASEEDWCNYIKEIPEAAQFKFKELQFSDKLDFIFDGGIRTGEMETSSGLKRQNDDSATSPFCGKEREKKPKNISGDSELKSAIIVNATPINTISSEQSFSSSLRRNGRAMWTPPVHKIFLDLCLQETLKGNKPGRYFTKEGWKNIIESFYSESGLKYDRIQFKNHWDSTKEQWKIWCNLIGTSYMKWDPSNKKFEASEEDWTNYLQSNPEAAHFRFKGLEFIDILDAIFNRNTIVGKSEPAVEQWKSNDSGVTLHLPAKEADAENLDEKTKCVLDAVASRNAIAISSTEGKRNYSIGECIECLDSMEEIEQGSDLYLFALDVFLKQEYREIFLQLKKPNLRVSWLERLQSD